MDDFGSGYSSLNLLKDYKFDVLKIDMAFLSSPSKRARNILSSVVAMTKTIGGRSLAEGVETKEQFEFLKRRAAKKYKDIILENRLPTKKRYVTAWIRESKLKAALCVFAMRL